MSNQDVEEKKAIIRPMHTSGRGKRRMPASEILHDGGWGQILPKYRKRAHYAYDNRLQGVKQVKWNIHGTVLIGAIMLSVLADSFCAIPTLLMTNGEEQ
jgi:hypothetical protein